MQSQQIQPTREAYFIFSYLCIYFLQKIEFDITCKLSPKDKPYFLQIVSLGQICFDVKKKKKNKKKKHFRM